MDIIDTKNLTKTFGNLTAVNKISLSIKKGEIFGLLGPNGAGKTTFLMMLATLLKPTSGSAKVNGFDVLEKSGKVRESIGMVFQDPSSDDMLTGYENLKLHSLLYNVPLREIDERIQKVLRLVDLWDRKNDRVKKYSGGMRRRLEIARGLIHNPEVLFLDEPTLGLDPQTREYIWQYIESLVKELKMTIIVTTHYMDEADQLCDRVAIIDHGKIAVLDSPKSLKNRLGGDVVKLKIDDRQLARLKRFNFVKKVEKTDGLVKLTVKDARKNIQKIFKSIGNGELIEIRSPTLNDVFLHYTGKEIRPESETPEGGWMEKSMKAGLKR